MLCIFFFFFFNDTATTEIYTLSLHDALPISLRGRIGGCGGLQLLQVALGAVVSLGEPAVSNTVLDQGREMLHLNVFLAPGDVAAPAGELIGGEAAGLLRLVQQGGGAIDVAVGERLGHFGRKQPLLYACDARVAGGGRL